jgi:transaldolase
MALTEKQEKQIYDITDTNEVFIQWIDRESYESITGKEFADDKKWRNFVAEKKDAFANAVSNIVEEV